MWLSGFVLEILYYYYFVGVEQQQQQQQLTLASWFRIRQTVIATVKRFCQEKSNNEKNDNEKSVIQEDLQKTKKKSPNEQLKKEF